MAIFHSLSGQSKWGELWQQCLRVDYKPIIHVSAIAKHYDPKVIVPEILKYQVKESDLVANREWFCEVNSPDAPNTRHCCWGCVEALYARVGTRTRTDWQG